jgi:hypothetical protein
MTKKTRQSKIFLVGWFFYGAGLPESSVIRDCGNFCVGNSFPTYAGDTASEKNSKQYFSTEEKKEIVRIRSRGQKGKKRNWNKA